MKDLIQSFIFVLQLQSHIEYLCAIFRMFNEDKLRKKNKSLIIKNDIEIKFMWMKK